MGEIRQREEQLETWQEEEEASNSAETFWALKKRTESRKIYIITLTLHQHVNNELLTEAEEQCVHTHGIHAEEAMSDEVGTNYQRLGRENHIRLPARIQTKASDPIIQYIADVFPSPEWAPSSSSEMEWPPPHL